MIGVNRLNHPASLFAPRASRLNHALSRSPQPLVAIREPAAPIALPELAHMWSAHGGRSQSIDRIAVFVDMPAP